MGLTEFEQKIIDFEAETTTSLAVFARENEAQTKEIHEIHSKLDKLLDPKNGIYSRIQKTEMEIASMKRSYKYVIGIAVFLGIALRDVAVRLIAKATG